MTRYKIIQQYKHARKIQRDESKKLRVRWMAQGRAEAYAQVLAKCEIVTPIEKLNHFTDAGEMVGGEGE